MEYYDKYIKYKNKYQHIKKMVVNAFNVMRGGNIDSDYIDGSVLGFGTDGIFEVMELEPGDMLISAALNSGYLLIDTAYAYGNIEVISKAIRQFGREKVFVNYKVVLNQNESKDFKCLVWFGLKQFEYIDCLMYHTVPTIDQLREDLPYIKELCLSNKVKTIGFSNLFPIDDEEKLKRIMDVLREYDVDQYFKFVEEEFSISLQDQRKRSLEICQKYGIKVMGYSAFGGKGYGVCSSTITPSVAYPQFNRYSHPKTWQLVEKEHLDPMMLNMAYLANRYRVIQLPTSRRSERIKNNIVSFNNAYKLLSSNKEYVDTIYEETSTSAGLPYNLTYISRVNLYEALKDKDYGIKIWSEFYNTYYRETYAEPRRFDRLSQGMLMFTTFFIENAITRYSEYQDTMQKMYSLLERLRAKNPDEYITTLKKYEEVIKTTFCSVDVSRDKLKGINIIINGYELFDKFKKSIVNDKDNRYYDSSDKDMIYVIFNKDGKDYVVPISGRFKLNEFMKDHSIPDAMVIMMGNIEIERDDLNKTVSEIRMNYGLNNKELIILDTGAKSFWHNPDGSINTLVFRGPINL